MPVAATAPGMIVVTEDKNETAQLDRVSNCTVIFPLSLYTLPYWSNPPFLIFDIRALWRSVPSARAPECQKLKMVG